MRGTEIRPRRVAVVTAITVLALAVLAAIMLLAGCRESRQRIDETKDKPVQQVEEADGS